MPIFVLIHSPTVGPATWSPVAERLRSRGWAARVPSLLTATEAGPPFWPRVVSAVKAGLAGTEADRPVVLVAHSNAGVFLPVITRDLGRPVVCSIFADATVPGPGGRTPVVGEAFLPFLRSLADQEGHLPRWTDWWDERDVAPLFPDEHAREVITDEQPRLPLAYYQEQVPVPGGWDSHRCAFLLFSAGYRDQAERARQRGWPVRAVPGEHLHQVVDPEGVTGALVALAGPALP